MKWKIIESELGGGIADEWPSRMACGPSIQFVR